MPGRYLETKTYINSEFTNLFKGNMFLVDVLAGQNNSGDGVNTVLKGLGHAILGNFSTDEMVIELTKIWK